jgi:hypothetical protein
MRCEKKIVAVNLIDTDRRLGSVSLVRFLYKQPSFFRRKRVIQVGISDFTGELSRKAMRLIT